MRLIGIVLERFHRSCCGLSGGYECDREDTVNEAEDQKTTGERNMDKKPETEETIGRLHEVKVLLLFETIEQLFVVGEFGIV